MRVIQHNANRPQAERLVWCTVCNSQLAVTDVDIVPLESGNAVLCLCCGSYFPVMTEAEVTAAYYNK